MAKTWFETRVRYEKTLDDGTSRKVTEAYLVDAASFTEAEARITDEMSPFIRNGFDITHISKDPISEVFNDSVEGDSDKWYKFKVNFITLDEKSGAEKKTKSTMYVRGTCLSGALSEFKDCMRDTMSDYEIFSITETPVIEVFTRDEE